MQRQMMASAVTLGQVQQQLATVADNIANVGTTGYKSRDAKFTDLLFQQIDNMTPADVDRTDATNRLTPSGIRDGSGARIGDTSLDLSMGTIEQTDNPLDLALTNDHQFFTVNHGGATVYTRNGAFNTQPDPNNPNTLRLLTKSGDALLGTNGQPITIPAHYQSLQISSSGAISVELANGTRVNAGQFGLVTISRPQLLEGRGNSLYALPNLAQLGIGLNDVVQPVAGNAGSVAQGRLENSNVDLTKEMADLINLQHNYQLNARSISIGDQMAGLVNGLLR
ncbi:flagellar hook-basal body protein [Sporolactobacillus shoreicorticis]|uniref:Flagellar hook-basal body protein n=1 Tax=Sporolactobacillus shoreicorticis TaxID=1923877 RepID=A0ABW5S4D8_9BACL|nr:flagellar hook-basal body protein [Sporolactobacillus shoreicorticis]MCO7127120.1 flagellar hook-basal body protein [Sporolactobacillus shoreicorticis]